MTKKLLLADDSVVIQKLVGLSFANEPFEIVSTDNGDDALARAREIRPDVVLADVVMPGLSGYEVCEAIRLDPNLAQTPVLLLTGTFEAFDEARASAAGANGQITKPFEAQALVERVNEVLAAAPVSAGNGATSSGVADVSSDETPFGANDGALSVEPSFGVDALEISADEEGLDALFGDPGDGAADTLDPLGGAMAIGQSMPEARPPESTSEILSDEMPRFSTGADPLDSATSLDAALEAATREADTTILMPRDDPYAATEPGNRETTGTAGASAPLRRFDDVPNRSETHSASTAAVAPPAEVPRTSTTDTLEVADLDATLATAVEPPSTPSPDATASPPAMPAMPADELLAAIEAAKLQAAQNQGIDLPPSEADVATTRHEPNGDTSAFQSPVAPHDSQEPALGASPVNEPAEIEFGTFEPPQDAAPGFGSADSAANEDPFATSDGEDSFSASLDLSETTIFDRQPEPSAPTALGARRFASDTSVAGFDVSTSDLVTASGANEAPPAYPEPEPLLEVPDLPSAYEPPAQAGIDDPFAGNEALFDELSTGSPLEEFAPTPEPSRSQEIAPTPEPSPFEAFGSESKPAPMEPVGSEHEALDPVPTDRSASPRVESSVPDLSPLMEQRIQETLEKVAWEAFSDLSESIVKQVMDRVERIAWEAIPQMAETLVREEIRKMKGEED